MNSNDLQILGVYRMKDKSYRKIIGIFYQSPDGQRKTASNPVGNHIEYVFCYSNGHDIGGHNPRTCTSTHFAKNVAEFVRLGSE